MGLPAPENYFFQISFILQGTIEKSSSGDHENFLGSGPLPGKWPPIIFDVRSQGSPRQHLQSAFYFNGRNSVNIADICTQFDTGTQNDVSETDLLSDLISAKSKMAAAAILKFTLAALTRPISHVFAQNFARASK